MRACGGLYLGGAPSKTTQDVGPYVRGTDGLTSKSGRFGFARRSCATGCGRVCDGCDKAGLEPARTMPAKTVFATSRMMSVLCGVVVTGL